MTALIPVLFKSLAKFYTASINVTSCRLIRTLQLQTLRPLEETLAMTPLIKAASTLM
jgi:hypothetical protein